MVACLHACMSLQNKGKERGSSKRRASEAVSVSDQAHSESGDSADGGGSSIEGDKDGGAPARRTCTACRRSKVKCDMGQPCARCIRFGTECIPTPPSRRGRPGERHGKRRKVHEVARPTKIEALMMDAATDGVVSPKEEMITSHFGLTYLVRKWFGVAVRRRSCELLSKAFLLAAQCRIPMDTIMDATTTGDFAASPMVYLSPLLFTAAPAQQDWVGSRISPAEIPSVMVHEVKRTVATIGTGWTLGWGDVQGRTRFFVSPQFERDIASWDEIRGAFRTSGEGESCPQAVLEMLLPKEEIPRIVVMVGSMLRQYHSEDAPPTPRTERTKLRRRDGTEATVQMHMTCRILGPDRSMYLKSFDLLDDDSDTTCPPTTSTSTTTATATATSLGSTSKSVQRTPAPPIRIPSGPSAALLATSFMSHMTGGGGGGGAEPDGMGGGLGLESVLPQLPRLPSSSGMTTATEEEDLSFLFGIGLDEWMVGTGLP
eukprot:m.79755 g.79755  ORF g.79755 m.79755 type:complete len:486 (-) comp9309_c0_seq3:33-1490(-)